MSTIEGGLNSSVDHGGRCYQVQTQCSERDAPVIESLVFHNGETLVRITASYDDIADRFGFNGDDGRHLLELQHADLIGKIRHGMLDDGDAPPPAPAEDECARLVDADGAIVDLNDVREPAVRALLEELGANLEQARPSRPEIDRHAPIQRRPWWRRLVISIRL